MNYFEKDITEFIEDDFLKVEALKTIDSVFNSFEQTSKNRYYVLLTQETNLLLGYQNLLYVEKEIFKSFIEIFDFITSQTIKSLRFGVNQQGFYFIIKRGPTKYKKYIIHVLDKKQKKKFETLTQAEGLSEKQYNYIRYHTKNLNQ